MTCEANWLRRSKELQESARPSKVLSWPSFGGENAMPECARCMISPKAIRSCQVSRSSNLIVVHDDVPPPKENMRICLGDKQVRQTQRRNRLKLRPCTYDMDETTWSIHAYSAAWRVPRVFEDDVPEVVPWLGGFGRDRHSRSCNSVQGWVRQLWHRGNPPVDLSRRGSIVVLFVCPRMRI